MSPIYTPSPVHKLKLAVEPRGHPIGLSPGPRPCQPPADPWPSGPCAPVFASRRTASLATCSPVDWQTLTGVHLYNTCRTPASGPSAHMPCPSACTPALGLYAGPWTHTHICFSLLVRQLTGRHPLANTCLPVPLAVAPRPVRRPLSLYICIMQRVHPLCARWRTALQVDT